MAKSASVLRWEEIDFLAWGWKENSSVRGPREEGSGAAWTGPATGI